MKSAIITSKGIEAVAKLEIKEILGLDSKVFESVVVFEPKELNDIAKLCYFSQTASRVIYLFDSFKFKSMDDIVEKVKKIDFSKFLNPEKSFKIKCERIGEQDFSSVDLSPELANVISDATDATPDFKNPDVFVYIMIVDDKCYVGIDFVGEDMAKRDYRLFAHAERLKATIAYSAARIAGYTGKEKLLDPFCNNGTIVLEAALFASKMSVNFFSKGKFAFEKFPQFEKIDVEEYFDELDEDRKKDKVDVIGFDGIVRNVSSSEKNAKAAGINKLVSFSRMDAEWMSTKFDDGEIDMIVSSPPIITKMNEKRTTKLHTELFLRAERILSKKGKIVLITPTPDKVKECVSDKFAVKEEIKVCQGKQTYWFLIIKKK